MDKQIKYKLFDLINIGSFFFGLGIVKKNIRIDLFDFGVCRFLFYQWKIHGRPSFEREYCAFGRVKSGLVMERSESFQ